ncbi:MAG: hypothetical protein HGA44_03475 [Cellulomonadaceae bacterium]|nr:hypothetical protein [Cellulomonadaceae bacterium]
MGLFRRAARAGGSEPDEALGFLTVAEADEVRSLVAAAFAQRGREVVIHPDHVEAADGEVFGLWNVAASCHAVGSRKQWRAVVRTHVDALVDTPPDPSELSAAELLDGVVLRVHGLATMPPESLEWLTYARLVAPDLIEVLVLDSPTMVTTLNDGVVAQHDREALQRAGLERLVREPIDVVERLDVDSDVHVDVVSGASVFVASKVLVLPDVLRRVYSERTYPHGVLVALPDRHHLLLHPLDGPAVVLALQAMASMAAEQFATAAGGVSPSVFWWLAGTMRRLSRFDEDGDLAIEVDPVFGDVLSRLTAGHEPPGEGR